MKKKSSLGLIILSYIAFISLGLPDGLHGVAWPGIRKSFGLPLDSLGFLLVSGTTGYMLSSFFSGPLVKKLGLGLLLSLSCAATALTLTVYSVTPFWWLFVFIAVVGGFGAGAIDAGLNHYIALNHNERMMQWLHASFGVGITLGPIIMTLGISLTGQWRPGYRAVALGQFLLAGAFFLTRKIWPREEIDQAREEKETGFKESLKNPSSLLSMLLFFLYTGGEIGLGLWAYSLLTESRGVSPGVAGMITGSYWGMFTLGRFLAGWYSRHVKSGTLLNVSVLTALGGILLVWLNPGPELSAGGIALTGFAIAPLFPGLVSDTLRRVGPRHQGNVMGMQIAAAGFGTAVIPSLAGRAARFSGLEAVPFFLFCVFLSLWLILRISYLISPEKREAS